VKLYHPANIIGDFPHLLQVIGEITKDCYDVINFLTDLLIILLFSNFSTGIEIQHLEENIVKKLQRNNSQIPEFVL
jgi:hypothetical protein